ncbi:MAG: PAS domain-containing protein [Inquilinus sp.]|nr:PAS domain-containing protein [Inquilinus sp.]
MNRITAPDIMALAARSLPPSATLTVAVIDPPWPAGTPDFVDSHPRFRHLHDYLVARAPKNGLPGRQHIDPTDIPHLLAALSFVDVERDGDSLAFRYRLVGTTCAEALGSDPTGRLVDDSHPSGYGCEIVAHMTEITERRQPGFGQFTVSLPGREHSGYSRIYFPLARNGSDVDMLVGVHAHHFEKGRGRHRML